MNLLYLKYAVEIEKFGTINKAAQSLFISQPHLSTSLKALEDLLGVKIFQRTKSGVTPTDEGREFLQYAKTIISQVEVLEERYAKKRDSTVDIKVASVRSSVFMLAFNKLVEKHRSKKNLRIVLHEDGFLEVLDRVRNDKADIGFILTGLNTRSTCLNLIRSNRLDYNYLTTIKPHILLSRDNEINEAFDTRDLHSYTYVAYNEFENSMLNLVNEHEMIHRPTPDKIVFVNDRCTLFFLLSQKKMYTISHKQPPDIEQKFNIMSIPCLDPSYDLELGYIIKSDKVVCTDIEQLISYVCDNAVFDNAE